MEKLTFGTNLSKVISTLQEDLNLHHWRIKQVDQAPTLPGALLEIRTIRDRNMANLYIGSAFWEMAWQEQVERLRHELVHLILDPLWEEHEFQVFHGIDNASRREEYKKRFRREVEKAVEHITTMPAVDPFKVSG